MIIKSPTLDYIYLDDGKDGIPAGSLYTYVKYSQNPNGIPMTDDSSNALYIGISYNNESPTESQDPLDYQWTLIKGDDGYGYTIVLSNENISFSVGVDSKPLDNQSYTCDVTVLVGATPKTDFTVGTPTGVPTGITATTSGKRVTVSVSTSTAIPNNTGSITVPITIDGNTINRVITYSLSVAGIDGDTIVSTTITYAASPYGDILPQSVLTDEHGLIIGDENGNAIGEPEWLPDPPQNVPDGWYVYTRTVFTFASGATSATYAIAKHGDTGTSVSQLTPEYRLSDSSTSLTGSGQGYTWSSVKPEMEVGQFIWERVRNDYSDGTTTYSNPTCDVTMSGVLVNVDNNTKSITNKVWQTDISTAIYDYNGGEGSASGTIKDRLSNAEQSIDGFIQTVSEMTTRFDGDEAWIETVETTAEQAADHFTWLVRSGSSQSSLTLTDSAVTAITNQFVIKDPAGSATIIEGGKIKANSITTNMLAANAIKSQNYQASANAQSPYSAIGSFLDLSNGNFYTPNFGVQGTGGAYINGSIIASSGQIGQNSTNYWEIGNARDYNMTDSAVIQSHGTAYIQAGEWQISNNKINTQKYESNSSSSGNLVYYKDTASNTWYDFGVKLPSDFSAASASDSTETLFHKSVFYGRKYTGNNIPSFDSSWDYLFQIDVNGNIYENGVKLSDKYAPATIVPDFSGELSINGKTYNGIDDVNVGTIGIAYGGTGKTSWTANGLVYASASNTLAQLGVGTSGYVLKSNGNAAPSWIAQSSLSVGSAASATKATQDGSGNVITSTYRTLANNTFDSATITDLSAGNIVATGSIRATNGIYGDLTGTASEATHAASATTATKATQDGNGANIASTYLPLSGGSMTGELYLKKSGINAQASNNGVSSTQYPTTFSINDTNNLIMTRLEAVVESSGNISAYWYVRNYNGSTTNVGQKGIKMTMDKTGALTYNVSDTDKFRSAIGLGNVNNTADASKVVASAGKLTTARSFTIGNTSKNVDWSGAVSFSKTDISGEATTTAAGWMSASDKSKLDRINLSDITDVITASTIIGTNGISVTVSDKGVATIKHANSAIAAGTTSGTSDTGNVAYGSTVTLPKLTYDAYGHITGVGTYTFKLPAAQTTITGNAGTATKFASNQSITLTGDTTGTASSQAGWSIATTTSSVSPIASIPGDDHAKALKAYFDAHKATIPRNKLINFYSSASGNGSQAMGYFLTSYDTNPYGGFFVAHYNNAYYVGIQGGTYTQQRIVTSTNYTDYTVTKTGTGASGTWAIGISGNAATASTSAALTGITAGRFVIGNGTSSAYASSQMSYYNNVDITANSHTVKRNGIHIWGSTYGNDANYLVSGVNGVLSWGDGGPQITFDTSGTPGAGQAGALIFTDHDSAATGASFHFVSNQGDWSVVSKRFVARTSVSIGIDPQHSSAGMQQVYNATTKSLDFVFY